MDSAIPLIRPEDVVLTPSRSPLCVVFQNVVMTNMVFFIFRFCLFGFSVERQRQNVEQVYISEGLWEDAEWKRGMIGESLAWTDAMLDNHHALYYFTLYVRCLISPILCACDIIFLKPIWTHVYCFFIYIIICHIFLTFIFHKSSFPFLKLQWILLL